MLLDHPRIQLLARRITDTLLHMVILPTNSEMILHQRHEGWFFMHIAGDQSRGWTGPFTTKGAALRQMAEVCRCERRRCDTRR